MVSLRLRAASIAIESGALICSWPTKSSSRCGRRAFSTASSVTATFGSDRRSLFSSVSL